MSFLIPPLTNQKRVAIECLILTIFFYAGCTSGKSNISISLNIVIFLLLFLLTLVLYSINKTSANYFFKKEYIGNVSYKKFLIHLCISVILSFLFFLAVAFLLNLIPNKTEFGFSVHINLLILSLFVLVPTISEGYTFIKSHLQSLQQKITNISYAKKAEAAAKTEMQVTKGIKTHIIKLADIAYVYSEDKCSFIVLFDNQSFVSYSSLTKLFSENLNAHSFYFANRSTIVSRSNILGWERNELKNIILNVKVSPGSTISVNKNKTKEFKEWFNTGNNSILSNEKSV